MSGNRSSSGSCLVCRGRFTKAAMTEHLEACALKASGGKGGGTVRYLHILVEAPPDYWLHVEVRATATLEKLDGFLRNTWLECCGHLSAFTIGDRRFAIRTLEDFGEEGLEPEETMDFALGEVLRVGSRARYEYDYGTTTELAIRVVGAASRPPRGPAIHLLARNDPPKIVCGVCRAPATHVCGGCADSETGWLCANCKRKHRCDTMTYLPIVNSPRVGVCGYEGPLRRA